MNNESKEKGRQEGEGKGGKRTEGKGRKGKGYISEILRHENIMYKRGRLFKIQFAQR